MVERQVCFCGSNRCWLLLLVALNIAVNAVSVVAIILGIKHNDDLEYWNYTNEDSRNVALGILYFLLGAYIIVLVLNVLPIFAEMKKKPKLHRPFRIWLYVVLVFQLLGLVALFYARNIAFDYISRILSACITVFTIVLIHRRIHELEAQQSPYTLGTI